MRIRLARWRALPGVEAIYLDKLEQLTANDRTPEFIGAPSAWNEAGGQAERWRGHYRRRASTPASWPEHPSFSSPDPLGKPYAAPPSPISGTRACEFQRRREPSARPSRNNKLIGADRFMATYDANSGLLPGEYTSARDDDGHGTHTSSTAVSNRGVQSSIFGISRGTVSGIARALADHVQGLWRNGLLWERLGCSDPEGHPGWRERDQLLDQRRREPLLRRGRAGIPRCL